MSKILKVELTPASADLVHQFRNFGEDVYHDLRDEGSISIEEIDSATSVFYVRDLKSKFARSAAAKVKKIAAKHKMDAMISVVELAS